MQKAASPKDVQFLKEVDPAVPTYIITDAARVMQIITNCVSNSLKFTPPGGTITLHVGVSRGGPPAADDAAAAAERGGSFRLGNSAVRAAPSPKPACLPRRLSVRLGKAPAAASESSSTVKGGTGRDGRVRGLGSVDLPQDFMVMKVTDSGCGLDPGARTQALSAPCAREKWTASAD